MNKNQETNEKIENIFIIMFSHSQWRQTFCAILCIHMVQSAQFCCPWKIMTIDLILISDFNLFLVYTFVQNTTLCTFVQDKMSKGSFVTQGNHSFLSVRHHHHKASFRVYHLPRRRSDRSLLICIYGLIYKVGGLVMLTTMLSLSHLKANGVSKSSVERSSVE